jgi:hypothetical protein
VKNESSEDVAFSEVMEFFTKKKPENEGFTKVAPTELPKDQSVISKKTYDNEGDLVFVYRNDGILEKLKEGYSKKP